MGISIDSQTISGNDYMTNQLPSMQTTNQKTFAEFLSNTFQWIYIPAGSVTLLNDWDDDDELYLKKDSSQDFSVGDFYISKYPVTNQEYAKFVASKGYEQQKWWTPEGWEWRSKENWFDPAYWREPVWNQPDYPVVGVSWFEAYAYCQWLREMTGKRINLPTEQQWQRAAQGDDKRLYPWGDNWDENRCNNRVNKNYEGRTTPVNFYEGVGDSPFGVVDLVGNVWEWCLTTYRTDATNPLGNSIRTLRGGSWNHSGSDVFRTICRSSGAPSNVYNCAGFRIVQNVID